jgi:membrane associated rhomboid family serine protease
VNFQLPPVTQALILINVVVYFGELLLGPRFFDPFVLYPFGYGFLPWQLLTYGFLHAGLGHLFFNMFAVFMFGSEIERTYGPRWFLVYYLVCVVTAGITQLAVAAFSDFGPAATIGASGGVFGVLLAFGMTFPRRMILLLIPPIPMPAWLLVTLYGLLELYLGISGRAPGVAHFAHLGGMVGGYFMILHRRGRFRR